MKRATLFIAAAVGLGAILGGAAYVASAPRPAFSAADEARLQGGDPARGKLVFDAGQCASCHASPGQSDRLRLGGGFALATARGTFRAPNISPHPTDGIGAWSAVAFANAMVSGVSPAGEHYYPAFPYTSYTHVRPDDLSDLFAYLKGLAPVEGRPPSHDLVFPLNVRRGIGLWKLVFFKPGPLEPDPAEDAVWNRGRYLVEGLAHCVECHSARNLAWAIRPETRFAGGLNPEWVGSAPNITPTRLRHWTAPQLAEMLRTGYTPEARYVGNTMADVVINLAALPSGERDAIAAYIKSLPARPTPAEVKQN